MRQTKRKIVALSTALAMALVLVASLVPSFGVKAQEITPSGMQVSLMPDGTLYDGYTQGDIARLGAGSVDSFTVDATNKVVTFTNLSVSRLDVDANGYTFVFNGTNIAETQFIVEEGVDDFTLSLGNNATLKAGSGEEYQGFYGKIKLAEGTTSSADISNAMGVQATVSGPAGGGSTDPVPVKEGDNQTVAPGSAVKVSFDKDYDQYFKVGGAVFLDDSTEPLSSEYYTAVSGSTVITLLDSFTKTLTEGAHTLKVKFNDDSVGTATFTVSASANSDGSASGTSGTATSGTSSSAATTTKVAAPKTADVLPFAAIAVVFVGATAIGVIAIRRKNS